VKERRKAIEPVTERASKKNVASQGQGKENREATSACTEIEDPWTPGVVQKQPDKS
jgi:hypothetical protein